MIIQVHLRLHFIESLVHIRHQSILKANIEGVNSDGTITFLIRTYKAIYYLSHMRTLHSMLNLYTPPFLLQVSYTVT